MMDANTRKVDAESDKEFSIRTMMRDAKQSAVNAVGYVGMACVASGGSSTSSKIALGIASAAAGIETARTIRLFRAIQRS